MGIPKVWLGGTALLALVVVVSLFRPSDLFFPSTDGAAGKGAGGRYRGLAGGKGKGSGGGGGGGGASPAGGGSASGGPLSSCSHPLVRRGEYTKEWAKETMDAYLGSPPRTSVENPACPRYVFAFQNHQAGFGHRLTNWAMALHTAVMLNTTFAHTSFDGGGGQHGNYNGWDKWLSFTTGEWGLDDVLKKPGLKRTTLPSVGGYYGYNEAVQDKWREVIKGPGGRNAPDTGPCNVLYQVPDDQWMFDISSTTKAIMAWKFAERATPKPAVEGWSEEEVNVAVHVRFGDQYPTPEHVHARVIRETVLPALRAAGVRARTHVHVFAEDKTGPKLPFLDALGREENVAVSYHPAADPQTSFWHLVQSDFLVMSFSSFSWAAAHVSLRTLPLAQPSSDIMRMCGEASACCEHSGQCPFAAREKVRQTALRLAAREQACGGLEG
jgi:hypothetical protein